LRRQSCSSNGCTKLTPVELRDRLSPRRLLFRTGIVLASGSDVADPSDLAVRLGMSYLDHVSWRMAALPEGARHLDVRAETLQADFYAMASRTLDMPTALVSNSDLLLAGLESAGRRQVWEYLFSVMKDRRTALAILLPSSAHAILPQNERARWRSAGRLADGWPSSLGKGSAS
jgi:hypothetical protein